MEPEPSKTTYWENQQKEEEKEHETAAEFVGEVGAKEKLALWEEVECELLYVTFIDNQ